MHSIVPRLSSGGTHHSCGGHQWTVPAGGTVAIAAPTVCRLPPQTGCFAVTMETTPAVLVVDLSPAIVLCPKGVGAVTRGRGPWGEPVRPAGPTFVLQTLMAVRRVGGSLSLVRSESLILHSMARVSRVSPGGRGVATPRQAITARGSHADQITIQQSVTIETKPYTCAVIMHHVSWYC